LGLLLDAKPNETLMQKMGFSPAKARDFIAEFAECQRFYN
jgi:hypothetical protein